jgi:hypothetical protein
MGLLGRSVSQTCPIGPAYLVGLPDGPASQACPMGPDRMLGLPHGLPSPYLIPGMP